MPSVHSITRCLAAGLLSLALALPAGAAPTPKPTAAPAGHKARPSATPEPQDRVPGEIVSQGMAGQVNWTSHKILSSGGGAAPDHGSPAQRRLLAERAALADAYRNLAEIIHGVHVDAETTVDQFVTQSDIIRTHVQGLVKGAVVSHKRFLSDGSVEVDVEIPLYGQDSLMEAMADQVLHKAPASSPSPSAERISPPLAGGARGGGLTSQQTFSFTSITWRTGADVLIFNGGGWDPPPLAPPARGGEIVAAAEVSGLIIDVHGLGLEPAMAPAILAADRHELYLGTVPVTPDIIINQGMVEYVSSMDLARKVQRVGANPLVVKAQAVSGRLKADVVLDADTAAKVTEADGGAHFLARAAVVLVL